MIDPPPTVRDRYLSSTAPDQTVVAPTRVVLTQIVWVA
jgi:hypothetical protein